MTPQPFPELNLAIPLSDGASASVRLRAWLVLDDKLLGPGIVKELTGQKRNRIYLATPILAAIQENAPAGAP